MNDRERFLATMRFGLPDRMPYWECAFWGETFARWIGEGMPESASVSEESLCRYFGFDRSFGVYFRGTAPIDLGFSPAFERTILSEEDGIITERGRDGVVSRCSKHGNSTRQFVRFPVETREDFLAVKKRLDPSTSGRVPADFASQVTRRQAEGRPTCIQAGGYYGFARGLMGLEGLSMAFHDQPALVEEIFEFRTEYVSRLLEDALRRAVPDFAEFWEDMAFKSGPLVSPALYRRLALKHYRAITDLLRRYGVDVILLDSDGNVDDLIPIWIDGGITCLWPLESASGMDPVAVRRKYGRALGLIGAIDKRALARGREAISEEVCSKVPFLVESGGFIPTCDHAVPPDVSLADYRYYLGLVHEIAEGR